MTFTERLGMFCLTEWMLRETVTGTPDWLHLLIWLSGTFGALCWLVDPLTGLEKVRERATQEQ